MKKELSIDLIEALFAVGIVACSCLFFGYILLVVLNSIT